MKKPHLIHNNMNSIKKKQNNISPTEFNCVKELCLKSSPNKLSLHILSFIIKDHKIFLIFNIIIETVIL